MHHYHLFVVALIAIVATAAAAPVNECRAMAKEYEDGWCQTIYFGGETPRVHDGTFITQLLDDHKVDILAVGNNSNIAPPELVVKSVGHGPAQLGAMKSLARNESIVDPVDFWIMVTPVGSCISIVAVKTYSKSTLVYCNSLWTPEGRNANNEGVIDGVHNGVWDGRSWIQFPGKSDIVWLGTRSTAEMTIQFIEVCHPTGHAAATALNAQA